MQRDLLSLCQLMRQRRYDDERLAMYFDYFKFRMLSNRQTKKSYVQRSGDEHLYLVRCEDITQGEHYVRIRVSKATD